MKPSDPNLTLVQRLQIEDERKQQGNWFPACQGSEVAFWTRTGYKLLYCYQPSTGRHAYLNVETDIILSDEEAICALSNY